MEETVIYQRAGNVHMDLFRDEGKIDENVLYTLDQSAEIAGRGRDTLTKHHKRGRLNIRRDGANKPLILGKDLIDFISVK